MADQLPSCFCTGQMCLQDSTIREFATDVPGLWLRLFGVILLTGSMTAKQKKGCLHWKDVAISKRSSIVVEHMLWSRNAPSMKILHWSSRMTSTALVSDSGNTWKKGRKPHFDDEVPHRFQEHSPLSYMEIWILLYWTKFPANRSRSRIVEVGTEFRPKSLNL